MIKNVLSQSDHIKRLTLWFCFLGIASTQEGNSARVHIVGTGEKRRPWRMGSFWVDPRHPAYPPTTSCPSISTDVTKTSSFWWVCHFYSKHHHHTCIKIYTCQSFFDVVFPYIQIRLPSYNEHYETVQVVRYGHCFRYNREHLLVTKNKPWTILLLF